MSSSHLCIDALVLGDLLFDMQCVSNSVIELVVE